MWSTVGEYKFVTGNVGVLLTIYDTVHMTHPCKKNKHNQQQKGGSVPAVATIEWGSDFPLPLWYMVLFILR